MIWSFGIVIFSDESKSNKYGSDGIRNVRRRENEAYYPYRSLFCILPTVKFESAKWPGDEYPEMNWTRETYYWNCEYISSHPGLGDVFIASLQEYLKGTGNSICQKDSTLCYEVKLIQLVHAYFFALFIGFYLHYEKCITKWNFLHFF